MTSGAPWTPGVLGQETVGAGGIAYALRTLPVALRAAQVIRDVAPGRLADQLHQSGRAGHRGAAHGAGRSGDRHLRLADRAGAPGEPRRRAARRTPRVEVDYVGINHLGWLRSLRVGDRDVLPGLLSDDAALESFEEGRLFGGPLLRALGCLPNEYAYFYYAAVDLVRALEHGQTRGEVVAAGSGGVLRGRRG